MGIHTLCTSSAPCSLMSLLMSWQVSERFTFARPLRSPILKTSTLNFYMANGDDAFNRLSAQSVLISSSMDLK